MIEALFSSPSYVATKKMMDATAMRQFGDDWSQRRGSSAATDDKVFELVALDRFFRTWLAG